MYIYPVVVNNPSKLPLQHVHPHAQKFVLEIVNRLLSYGVTKIIVFGSALDHKVYSQDSDIDIAIVCDSCEPKGLTFRNIGKSVDLLIYTDADVLQNPHPFSVEDAIRKGVVLYER